MDLAEYERYGRQMIVPGVGLQGQLRLKNARVLVVGAGGLGCPAIAYLGGAGIGRLGIVDGDTVEVSNLHRQILHTEPGILKAESAANYVRKLNPKVDVAVYAEPLTPANASAIVSEFDLVLDCTDSPMSRYLVNDACVLGGKPLVSASALKTEGQLAVYHYGDGPCYRCLFPVPPPPELVGSCGDSGVLGPVVGIMGVFQAVEALRVLLGEPIEPNLAIFSMFSFPQWRQMKIRRRQPTCAVCGSDPQITDLSTMDYAQFCGAATPFTHTGPRITAAELRDRLGQTPRPFVLDVRPAVQFEMCSLPDSTNVPIADLKRIKSPDDLPFPDRELIVVCRLGNDSQQAAAQLAGWGLDVVDVAGGLHSWSAVEPSFPRY